jgi:uncharacterized DUF497 family protein
LIFAWDEKNREHLGKHDVTPAEAEFVVENAEPPFPQHIGDGKRRVWGATNSGRMLQVIYVLKAHDQVEYDSVSSLDWVALERAPDTKIVRIIHAMDLTPEMKRLLRRRRR